MGSLSPDSTAGPHLEHCGAEEHPVDSAEGARDARRSHDLHTHSYGTRQVGAQGLRKVLCRPKTSENDHAYPPHSLWGDSLSSILFQLFRSTPVADGSAESQIRSETNTLSHLV